MSPKYIFFLDFDGTITTADVGYEMFKKFTDGRTQTIVDEYRKGEVNSYACLNTECDIWNESPPNEKEVIDFIEMQGISKGFKNFCDLLQENGIKSYVVSEGFEFYIDRILDYNGLSNLAKITNMAVFSKGIITPEFPYRGKGCGECSNCKGYHIKRLMNLRSSAVFIGDGHSDIHGAAAADIIFAKSFLRESLDYAGRYYFQYVDFFDIIKEWSELHARDYFCGSDRIALCGVNEKRRGNFESLWELPEVMTNVGYPNGLGWSSRKYDQFWRNLRKRDFILFAIEDNRGKFLGEAKLAFPDSDKNCCHDVKLLPEFQGRGIEREAWRLLLEMTERRWQNFAVTVTPGIDNTAAINLYKSLGFEFEGKAEMWTPPPNSRGAERVEFIKMVKR